MSVVFDSHLDNLKAAILNGSDPDAKNAITAINKEIEYLKQQTYNMQRYAKFAKLTGGTYVIDAPIAAWLDLATKHDAYEYSPDNPAFKLQYVNVREHAGRTWLVATDGYRLHAYEETDLPVGVYLMVDNILRQVDSVFPDWTTIAPSASTILAVDEYAMVDDMYAGWNFLNGNLVKFDPRRPYKLNENYRLNKRYYRDALRLGGEPVFSLSGTSDKYPHPYQRTMQITWPNAFALIQPAMPEIK